MNEVEVTVKIDQEQAGKLVTTSAEWARYRDLWQAQADSRWAALLDDRNVLHHVHDKPIQYSFQWAHWAEGWLQLVLFRGWLQANGLACQVLVDDSADFHNQFVILTDWPGDWSAA